MRTDRLFLGTLGYLLLPNVLFFVGWLRSSWAIVVVAAVVPFVVDLARRSRTDMAPLSRSEWCVVAVLAVFWTFSAGIGELNAQTGDYYKHNLVFHDLTVHSWPVVYPHPDLGDPLLCYYLAYYLPASLLAKLAGLQHAATLSLVWALVGVGLAFAWVARLGRPHGGVVVVLFTLADGVRWLPGVVQLARNFGLVAGASSSHWWLTENFTSRFWVFSHGHTPLGVLPEPLALMWSPQHTLGAWLATACVLSCLRQKQPPRALAVICAASMLWSPFVAIGLIPLAAGAFLYHPERRVVWPDILAAVAIGVPVALYFHAHAPLQYIGLLFGSLAGSADWLKYALFLVLAVGAPWAGAALVRRRYRIPDTTAWRFFCLASLTLVVTTFVVVGRYNDWVVRVSMPSLFVLHLTLATMGAHLWVSPARLAHRLAFAAFLLLSAERPLKLYLLAPLGRAGGQGVKTTIATAQQYADSMASFPAIEDMNVAALYLGSRDSFFARHLMRTATGP